MVQLRIEWNVVISGTINKLCDSLRLLHELCVRKYFTIKNGFKTANTSR